MLFDALFRNGRFRTQDPRRPLARALGVHRGRVISLDDELAPDRFRSVHDLGGAAVVPGFHDAHHHLAFAGQASLQLDLRPAGVRSMDELLAAVHAAAADAPEGAWVIGAGYDQNCLGAHPIAEQLDAVARGRPVYLIHNSRHMGVANTKAFELAGFPGRRGVPTPDGGAVPTDGSGRALGLLQETARSLVTDCIPAPTVEDVADYIAAGSALALAGGSPASPIPGSAPPNTLAHRPRATSWHARRTGSASARPSCLT